MVIKLLQEFLFDLWYLRKKNVKFCILAKFSNKYQNDSFFEALWITRRTLIFLEYFTDNL